MVADEGVLSCSLVCGNCCGTGCRRSCGELIRFILWCPSTSSGPSIVDHMRNFLHAIRRHLMGSGRLRILAQQWQLLCQVQSPLRYVLAMRLFRYLSCSLSETTLRQAPSSSDKQLRNSTSGHSTASEQDGWSPVDGESAQLISWETFADTLQLLPPLSTADGGPVTTSS